MIPHFTGMEDKRLFYLTSHQYKVTRFSDTTGITKLLIQDIISSSENAKMKGSGILSFINLNFFLILQLTLMIIYIHRLQFGKNCVH